MVCPGHDVGKSVLLFPHNDDGQRQTNITGRHFKELAFLPDRIIIGESSPSTAELVMSHLYVHGCIGRSQHSHLLVVSVDSLLSQHLLNYKLGMESQSTRVCPTLSSTSCFSSRMLYH